MNQLKGTRTKKPATTCLRNGIVKMSEIASVLQATEPVLTLSSCAWRASWKERYVHYRKAAVGEVAMHIVEQSHTYWKAMSGFSKILCPTDFSKHANHAIEDALRLPGLREVIVQHVVSTYFEEHPHWSTLFDIHETQKHMDMYVDTEMLKVPRRPEADITYRSVISEGKPAQQIVKLAEREKVDAIVMGPAKGVVTAQVIHAASRPVLIIPESDQQFKPLEKISRILVPTDCSPYSKMVVDYAFQLKQLIKCELFLLYVIEFSNGVKFGIRQGHVTDAASKIQTWAKVQLENLTPAQFIKDDSVHQLVDEGPVSDRIAEIAAAHSVDLVIVGAHGYGPVEKHFVGTTAASVLNKVARPMLVVKI
jgi:nucleotide-binding universal stress UspA family protein